MRIEFNIILTIHSFANQEGVNVNADFLDYFKRVKNILYFKVSTYVFVNFLILLKKLNNFQTKII